MQTIVLHDFSNGSPWSGAAFTRLRKLAEVDDSLGDVPALRLIRFRCERRFLRRDGIAERMPVIAQKLTLLADRIKQDVRHSHGRPASSIGWRC